MMLLVAPLVRTLIFGHSLTFMVLYVWARRNQHVRMSLFGLFNFNAPYLPWVMLLLSMLLGTSPTRDLLGIAVGHIYFFAEDVLPRMVNGRRYLAAPQLLKRLFGEAAPPAIVMQPLPEDARQGAGQGGPIPPAPAGNGHAHVD